MMGEVAAGQPCGAHGEQRQQARPLVMPMGETSSSKRMGPLGLLTPHCYLPLPPDHTSRPLKIRENIVTVTSTGT